MPIYYVNTGSIDYLTISSSAIVSGSAVVSGSLVVTGSILVGFGGVRFPATQVSSSDFNTLDDYEEGYWTPALNSGTAWAAFSATRGTFTKIGSNVTVSFYIALSGTQAYTSSAHLRQLIITNLPFTASSVTNANYFSSVAITAAAASTSISTPALTNAGTTQIAFYRLTAAAANSLGTAYPQNGLGTGGVVQGSLNYRTDF